MDVDQKLIVGEDGYGASGEDAKGDDRGFHLRPPVRLSRVGMTTARIASAIIADPIRYGLHSGGMGRLAESMGRVASPPAKAASAVERLVATFAKVSFFMSVIPVLGFDFLESAYHFPDRCIVGFSGAGLLFKGDQDADI